MQDDPGTVGAGPYREPGDNLDVLRAGLVRHQVALREAREEVHDLKQRVRFAEAQELTLEKLLKKERMRRKLGDLAVALVAALSVAPFSWCFDVAPRHGAGYAIAALVAWLLFWRIR